jgi:hypothetical protein
MRKTKLIGLLVGVYLSAYLLTNKHLSSMIVAIILALCMEIMLKSYENWDVDTNILDGNIISTEYQELSAPTRASTVKCDEISNRNTCNSDNNPRCSWYDNGCVDNSILMHSINDDGQLELSSPLKLKCRRRGQTDCVSDDNDCSWEESNERCVDSRYDGFEGSNVVESFKGKSKKKRRRRRRKVENFDDDEVNESYIDLGSSFLEAYKSLTPRQIERMSSDTKSLMGHQKKLIETLDNLGPVIKGGKKIMEQFKHYFKDEI